MKQQTSFGDMQVLWQQDGQPKAELLHFERNGRPHRHPDFESFFVLKGSGKVYAGSEVYDVKEGDLVVIPPKTNHWMEVGDQSMTGLLWYHNQPLQLKSASKG